MHRIRAEDKLEVMRVENDTCKARLIALQDEFKQMENMVRNLLEYKNKMDQIKQEKESVAANYKNEAQKLQNSVRFLEQENKTLKSKVQLYELQTGVRLDDFDKSRLLLERLKKMEVENSQLVLENEQQRMQYEKCLDEIAGQVVQALLMQKSLRSECMNLQGRVQDLEQQNRYLSAMVSDKVRFASDSMLQSVPSGRKWKFKNASGQPMKNASYQSLPIQSGMPKGNMSRSHDSVKSAPNNANDWTSEMGMYDMNGMPELSVPPPWLRDKLNGLQSDAGQEEKPQEAMQTRVETEFPANNGSPKMKRVGLGANNKNTNIQWWMHRSSESVRPPGGLYRNHSRSYSASEVPTRDYPDERSVSPRSDTLKPYMSKTGSHNNTVSVKNNLEAGKRDSLTVGLADYEAYSKAILNGDHSALTVKSTGEAKPRTYAGTPQVEKLSFPTRAGANVNILQNMMSAMSREGSPSRPNTLQIGKTNNNMKTLEQYLEEPDTPTPILTKIQAAKAKSNLMKDTNSSSSSSSSGSNGYATFSEITPSPNQEIQAKFSVGKLQEKKHTSVTEKSSGGSATAAEQKRNGERMLSAPGSPASSQMSHSAENVFRPGNKEGNAFRPGNRDEGYSSMSSEALSEKMQQDKESALRLQANKESRQVENGRRDASLVQPQSQSQAAKPKHDLHSEAGMHTTFDPQRGDVLPNQLQHQKCNNVELHSSNSSIESASLGKVKDIRKFFESSKKQQSRESPPTLAGEKLHNLQSKNHCPDIRTEPARKTHYPPSSAGERDTSSLAYHIQAADANMSHQVYNPKQKGPVNDPSSSVGKMKMTTKDKCNIPTSRQEVLPDKALHQGPEEPDLNTSMAEFGEEWLDMCNEQHGAEDTASQVFTSEDVFLNENMALDIENKFRNDFYSLCHASSDGDKVTSKKYCGGSQSLPSPRSGGESMAGFNDSFATDKDCGEEFGEISKQIEDLSKTVDDLQKSLSSLSDADADVSSPASVKMVPEKDSGQRDPPRLLAEMCWNRSWTKQEPQGKAHSVDLTNPEERANLLDALVGNVTTSDSEVEKSGQKKDKKMKKKNGHPKVVRSLVKRRPSLDRNFFVRCGTEEETALAQFNFLQEIGSPEGRRRPLPQAMDNPEERGQQMFHGSPEGRRCPIPQPVDNPEDRGQQVCQDSGDPEKGNQTVSQNLPDSLQAVESELTQNNRYSAITYIETEADTLSLSDSCCESFSSSCVSINDATEL
ncbi:uncharacterized protein LOC106152039 isoform X2 [Lingula anatina]|nr:uncharacterized protein LOC106152039 isoform X2 [Lingula anatina]|eukprot:XP_013380962.2 uncharacterized protein LOC106152039 isoform X2 [Lingula anatina]